jgi:hypothetical protein
MHESNYDTHDCAFKTHMSDFYTQIVILTRLSVIIPHECNEDTHECDLYTHELNYNTMRVALTRINKNLRMITKNFRIGF